MSTVIQQQIMPNCRLANGKTGCCAWAVRSSFSHYVPDPPPAPHTHTGHLLLPYYHLHECTGLYTQPPENLGSSQFCAHFFFFLFIIIYDIQYESTVQSKSTSLKMLNTKKTQCKFLHNSVKKLKNDQLSMSRIWFLHLGLCYESWLLYNKSVSI